MIDIKLFIDGHWRAGVSGDTIALINPATNGEIGRVAVANEADLEEAVLAADRGFKEWRALSGYARSQIIRAAAGHLAQRQEEIALLLTREQGKPLVEARLEIGNSVALIEWFAEEARRSYGRLIPARAAGVVQRVIKEPIGPVAAFTPWNFPIAQSTRKIAAALAAGCSMVLKGSEETPSSVAALVECFAAAGVPKGVLNLVYGVPAAISSYLIPHPKIRKVSFTGSTVVGKQLAEMAGRHMKRGTFELGGHAPAIVFEDADVDLAANRLAGAKYRNAGQVCIAPTRMMVQRSVYDRFVERFVARAKANIVGNGEAAETTMGALVNGRRVDAMTALVADAVRHGASVLTGGERIGNTGNFFAPTVLTDVSLDASAMNDEPFGPIALIAPFDELDAAIAEANRLPYGLAAYAYTGSAKT
ncbi:MAG TPA: NAD-dependent succinate-semialdehyde dehydrogenase, partial [Devosia sp.]|nr:NAD-dependent succinate-semialdehyde dehydrogenase [Devosia sp.]